MSQNLLDQMGIAPFDDKDEDFAPSTWGGRRPNAGPPFSSLRNLDISAIGIEFDEPVTYSADITIEKCAECGRMGWSSCRVVVQAMTPRAEPGEDVSHYPILASVLLPGQPLRHKKECPLYEKQKD